MKEYRKTFFREISDLAEFRTFTKNVICYRGSTDPAPDWMDTEPGSSLSHSQSICGSLTSLEDKFTVLCRLEADMRQMARNVNPIMDVSGKTFYRFNFHVVLLFGLTELKAHIAWNEGVRP